MSRARVLIVACGGPRCDRRAGLAIATVARNLGLAVYVAESSESTVVAIPTILAFALLAILLAIPCSRWMKGRLAAGPVPPAGQPG